MERLNELELSRTRFEADIEGLLLKAEGKLKAAANAEARERSLKASYEKLADPFDDDSDEVERELPEGYAPASQTEELQPMYVDMAPNHKAAAINRKFGR
jgi:hypothetical protein